MRLFILTLVSLLIFTLNLSAQGTFFANSSGNWNNTTIWDTPNPGDGNPSNLIPGATDFVVTFGNTVRINGNYECAILLVQFDTQSIVWQQNGFFASPYTLTVNDYLGSVDGFGAPTVPTVSLIEDNTRLTIALTGTTSNSLAGDLLSSWNATAPFRNLTITPGGGNTSFISDNFAMTSGGILNVTNGTFTIQSQLSDPTTNANLNVSSGTVVTISGTVNGGSAATNFGTVTNDGAINIGISGYLNTNTFNMNANSTLNVANNQPNGWWHATSPGPGSTPFDVTSTVNYDRIGAQGIAVGSYGNLSMISGSGIKTLNSTGALVVLGNLTIGGSSTFDTSGNPNVIDISGNIDNDGIWAPTQLVNLNGGTAQNIGGNTNITFIGGLNISGASTVVQVVSPQDIIISGMLDVGINASFSPNGRQVNLAGNLVNDGTIIASGSFVFDGTTTVSGGGTAAFNNVTVLGTLSAPSQTATIAGNFTNNGTFSNVNGTVTFNGVNAQSISGSSTNEFYNLNITNTGATVSNNATTNLNTAMTMAANTTFDADGSGASVFTVRSTSGTNTARIEALPSSASITGNLVVQRYFNLTTGLVGTGVWRNFGVAVNGATVGQITAAGFTINGNDLAREDETLGGSVNDRFELQSSFGASIANNEGYTMFTRNADVPAVIGFTGTLNQGTQSMPITYTSSGTPSDDGWNLVNNPFPSTVDWDNMNRVGAISGSVSVWNTDTDTYDTWNGTTGGLSNGLIASGQAFWIQTTGGGASLDIPESAKVTSSTTFLRSSAEDEITNQIIVALSQDEKIDRTYIHFREDAVDAFNNQLDGRKLTNGIFNIASLSSDDVILAINSLSSITNCTKEVKLQFDEVLWDNVKNENFRGFTPGTYELNFSGLNSFTQALDFVLVDNYNGNIVSTPITENLVYSFVVDTTKVNSWGANRFLIKLSEKTIVADVVHTITPKCELGTEITFSNTQAGLLYSIEKNGALIVEKLADGSDLIMTIPIGKTVVGSNSFDLNLINGSCSNLVLQNEIAFESSQLLEISSVTDGESCGSGQILLKAEGAIGTAYYNWYETIDAVDPIPAAIENEYLTPVIDASKSYYVSIVNENGCESAKVEVIAEIVYAEQPEVQQDDKQGVLTTSAVADSYAWYKEGVLLEGEAENSLLLIETGNYEVEIIANGCASRSDVYSVDRVLGLKELEQLGISIYPNPVSDILKITNGDRINSLIIYDTKGVAVYRSSKAIPNEINLSSIKKGIYIINIATDSKTINYRVRKK